MAESEQFACLVAVGDDRVGLVRDITAVLLEHGLNIPSIRSSALGAEFAILAYFGGTVDQIDAAEESLSDLQRKTGLSFLFHESKAESDRSHAKGVTHDVFVTAYDAVGIVSELTMALANHNINIDRLAGDRYPAPNQGLPLFTISASIRIPDNVAEKAVREELEALRDRKRWADIEMHPHAQFDDTSLQDAPPFPPKTAWTRHEAS